MASLGPIDLEIIHDGAARGVVVKFDVLFSEKEQELDLQYFVRGMLVEKDQAQDRFILRTNGPAFGFDSVARQEKDDFIGFFGLKKIRPNGQSSRPIELKMDFDNPAVRERVRRSADPGSGVGESREELFAIVHVYSELSPSTAFSDTEERNITGV